MRKIFLTIRNIMLSLFALVFEPNKTDTDYREHMNKQEQDAFVHAFITRIGGVDEDKVAPWVRGESVDLPYKHIEILNDALSFWLFAVEFTKKRIIEK